MFVALRNFSGAEGKFFWTGEVVPDEYATDRAIELGCVAKVPDSGLTIETKTKTEPKKQILTEDTSNVSVEITETPKEETKKSKK